MESGWNKTITFDRFIRWCLITLLVVGVFMLLKRLSSVLLPFGVAWLVSYLLHPLVCFFQYKCRFKYRILAILAHCCGRRTLRIVLVDIPSDDPGDHEGEEHARELSPERL